MIFNKKLYNYLYFIKEIVFYCIGNVDYLI